MLTAKLIEYANSPLLARANQTNSVKQGIVVIGIHDWQQVQEGLQIKSGPYESSGQTVLDIEKGWVVSSDEHVTSRLRTRYQPPDASESGETAGLYDATSNAQHTIVVKTQEQRETDRKAAAKH